MQDTLNIVKSHANKFQGQDLEMFYIENQLKPEIEKQVKSAFYEIKHKKFDLPKESQ